MRKSMGKTLIIEGPDGAGKSFLANWISEKSGQEVYHGGGPSSKSKIVYMADNVIKNGEFIYDRDPVISELVYGSVLREHVKVTRQEMAYYFKWMRLSALIVYCRPSFLTLQAVALQEKSHKSPEHIELVKRNLRELTIAYDDFMTRLLQGNFNVVFFDRDYIQIEYIWEKIQRRREHA